MVSLIFLIVFLPSMLFATYVFDKFDLRAGICVGAILQGVGAALKSFVNYGFWIVILGQGLIGIAQPFLLDSPGKGLIQFNLQH